MLCDHDRGGEVGRQGGDEGGKGLDSTGGSAHHDELNHRLRGGHHQPFHLITTGEPARSPSGMRSTLSLSSGISNVYVALKMRRA